MPQVALEYCRRIAACDDKRYGSLLIDQEKLLIGSLAIL
jgi:hypothetical protein